MKGKISIECLMPLKMFLSRETRHAFSILREAPGMSAELELEGFPLRMWRAGTLMLPEESGEHFQSV